MTSQTSPKIPGSDLPSSFYHGSRWGSSSGTSLCPSFPSERISTFAGEVSVALFQDQSHPNQDLRRNSSFPLLSEQPKPNWVLGARILCLLL